MSRNIASTVLALLLVCGTAHASSWKLIGEDTGKAQVFIDVSSIRIEGSIRRAWAGQHLLFRPSILPLLSIPNC
jgi:hypothetical protein